MQLPKEQHYTVYAAVYPRPPPSRQMRTLELAIFDRKGRLVESLGKDAFVGEYGHHFTKNQARIGIASILQADYGIELTERNVHVVTETKVMSLIENAKRGGFHVFLRTEHVPDERALYVRAIYRLDIGNKAWPVRESMDMIRTKGNEDEQAVKRLLVKYLSKTYGYSIESDEIHFMTEKERKKFETLVA